MKTPPPLHPHRHLGVRSRQHAVSASRQSVAAGRCADRRISSAACLKMSPEEARRDPEGLLPPLRHHHARHDDRAWRARRRLSRLCAPDRSFAAAAEPGDGGGDRQTSRTQADPDQRLDRPCRQGSGSGSASARISRRCSTSSPPNSSRSRRRRPTRNSSRDHGVDPQTSAMFEDLARNLVVPHQLGMTTVLVVPDGAKEVVREDWELEGRGRRPCRSCHR